MILQQDKYLSFEDLAAEKIEGIDYQIIAVDRSSPVLIMAPHGGMIEPCTSEIAISIAGSKLSLYRFEGIRRCVPHRELHITSTRFNEPIACALVEGAMTVVAVHGRMDNGDGQTVWVGGLDNRRRDRIADALVHVGFAAEIRQKGQRLAGVAKENICNRGLSKAGTQIEIPQSLRDQLGKDPQRREAFAAAVCKGIAQ